MIVKPILQLSSRQVEINNYVALHDYIIQTNENICNEFLQFKHILQRSVALHNSLFIHLIIRRLQINYN